MLMLFSTTRTLVSWVRIRLGAWIYGCDFLYLCYPVEAEVRHGPIPPARSLTRLLLIRLQNLETGGDGHHWSVSPCRMMMKKFQKARVSLYKIINTLQNCGTGWAGSRVTPELPQLCKSVCIVGGGFFSELTWYHACFGLWQTLRDSTL
jgi:hypothetical protein